MYEALDSIGLTRTEARIYAVLVDLGRAQAGELSRKTGIHRRSVYDALERLIEKGLVSFIKENEQRIYLPVSPERIREMAEKQHDDVIGVLPSLMAKFNEQKTKQTTLFYRGLEGLKTIFEDQISEGKDVFIIGAATNASEILKYYIPHYTNKRVKRKIKLYLIYAGERRQFPIPLAEVRYLSKEFATPVSTNIYGDNVAIIQWSHEPVAILIKNKDIAQAYRNYFSLLWKMAKE
ncbi:BlaI/MecI/CopY family transcriptional regulator [Candidatus Woesearchaeota archaeon]|nr:BlaI/MecI/CopY family transcriptional regulator [Candidatus Woesearchaeota archaeon]